MMRLVRWILDDYLRTQRIWVEWIAAVGIAYGALHTHSDTISTLATWSLSVIAFGLYTTSVIADLAEQPMNLVRVLQVQSRRIYIGAHLIAAFLIVASSYTILVGATYIFAPLAFPAWQTWLVTIPAVTLLSITSIVIMVLLTPLVATPLQRLTLLALIAVPLAWDRVIGALPDMLPGTIMATFQAMSTVFGIILWPCMQLYALTINPQFTAVSIGLASIHLVVVTGLIALVFRWYGRRTLTIA